MSLLKSLVVALNVLCFFCVAGNTSRLCGKKNIFEFRVVHGNDTKPNEWPWLAGLVHVPSNKFFCGGSIVSETCVLTAAHCIQIQAVRGNLSPALTTDDILVHLGKYDLNVEREKGSESFTPKEILVHPSWDLNSVRADADLAILVSERRIQFSNKISPVCLWSDSVEGEEEVGTVVGWGRSENKNKNHENTPREVELKRIGDYTCFTDYPQIAYLVSTIQRTFCASSVVLKSGICNGDSGESIFI